MYVCKWVESIICKQKTLFNILFELKIKSKQSKKLVNLTFII